MGKREKKLAGGLRNKSNSFEELLEYFRQNETLFLLIMN